MNLIFLLLGFKFKLLSSPGEKQAEVLSAWFSKARVPQWASESSHEVLIHKTVSLCLAGVLGLG